MSLNMKKKTELLAPAGNFEKLEIAIHYGADAVYLAGKDFSLRNFSGNFTPPEMADAIRYAHGRGVKVYVACNIYARNCEQQRIESYLESLGELGPDALIVADPGILMQAARLIPQVDLHLSTQANTTNFNTARFWESQGVTRVNVARELSLSEIREIAANCSAEVEAFIHGAMCISYSGRCLLSSFMADRDSNRGLCCHPCRWGYAVVEEKRPGEYHPIMEDSRGSYIFNSRDLCMVGHIPDLISSGIHSLKIEGRMKGINYLASVVKVYREAIDTYFHCPDSYTVKDEWVRELSRISHREYSTGFFFKDAAQTTPNYTDSKPTSIHLFVGKVLERLGPGRVRVGVRNKLVRGDAVEILAQRGEAATDTIEEIFDLSGISRECAQPNSEVILALAGDYSENDIIRRP